DASVIRLVIRRQDAVELAGGFAKLVDRVVERVVGHAAQRADGLDGLLSELVDLGAGAATRSASGPACAATGAATGSGGARGSAPRAGCATGAGPPAALTRRAFQHPGCLFFGLLHDRADLRSAVGGAVEGVDEPLQGGQQHVVHLLVKGVGALADPV